VPRIVWFTFVTLCVSDIPWSSVTEVSLCMIGERVVCIPIGGAGAVSVVQ